MIVAIEIPGGSIAQGDLLLRIGSWATINAGGLILAGTLIERETRAIQPPSVIFRCAGLSITLKAVSGEKSGVGE